MKYPSCNAVTKIVFMITTTLSLTGCTSMLYQPSRSLLFPPDKVIQREPRWINYFSRNGALITAWHFQSNEKEDIPPLALVIQFHGNGENMTSHYLSLAWLLEQGVDLMTFDYQGYGLSSGRSSPENTVHDGMATILYAHHYLKKKNWTENVPIIVVGQSLGGAVALRVLSELPREIEIPLVVLDSTFIEYTDAARSVLRRSWITWPFHWLGELVISDEYSASGRLDSWGQNTRFIVTHDENDPIIGFGLGRELFELLPTIQKEFWPTQVGGHIYGFMNKESGLREKLIDRIQNIKKTSTKQK